MYDRAAQRILAQHPDIARHDIYMAVVCGNREEVQRILAANPDAARAAGGLRGWTPLLYLCYARFTHGPTIDNAVDIARVLLDKGANPNDFYMAYDSTYSALVGVAGEGEQDSPRQPYASALYALLLARGAAPYDIQVLYNTHFSADMIWWLELSYRHAVKIGLKADWDDPSWSMFDMGGYGPGAFFVLNAALERNNLELAEWALTHGASPNADTSSNPKFKPPHTLYEVALVRGQADMAELLRRHGAKPPASALQPEEAFVAACMRLDRATAQEIVRRYPEFLGSRVAIFEAAKHDRADAIALMLDLGVSIELENRRKVRALHEAAGRNALRAATLLVERGAEIDPKDAVHDNTPLGWAAHFLHVPMMDFLSRHSRDVWNLAFCGYVERLRHVLHAEPDLAKQVKVDGVTPLWWLPDDDEKAMEIVDLLLAAGADPAIQNGAGRTAADWARTRGMTEIARRLDAAVR
jgi:ankyrin repeat protein